MSYNYIEKKVNDLISKFELNNAGFDLNLLLNKLNIEISNEDLSDEVSGIFLMINGKPLITINSKESNNKERQRFTIAHEIGHYILHSDKKTLFVDKSPKLLYRNSASSTGEILQEKEANHFAACLLMPKELLMADVKDVKNSKEDKIIKNLASKYKVSEQAMSFRLANLGFEIGY